MALDLYHVKGEAGKVGTPGAPILSFQLLVNAVSGKITGHAEITHGGLPPPNEPISISNLTGHLSQLGEPPNHHVVTLKGTYVQSFPPPAIGEILEHFHATLSVDGHWNGHGSFTYGGHTVNNVPVKKLP
jgi:hypothetical protein